MKKIAIIVAGGSGLRMGGEIPKQFMELDGKPVLTYTVDAFHKTFDDISIVVVLPKNHLDFGKSILEKAFPNIQIQFAEGGITRFESVKSGLSLVNEESIIFVHDAVRCLVSTELIKSCYQQSIDKGSAIPVVPIKDSIRLINEHGSIVIDREKLRAVQTPQTFKSSILLPAFQVEVQPSFTDEATVVEMSGHEVNLIPGEESNIKITVPTDLDLAREVLKKRN